MVRYSWLILVEVSDCTSGKNVGKAFPGRLDDQVRGQSTLVKPLPAPIIPWKAADGSRVDELHSTYRYRSMCFRSIDENCD